MSIITMATSKGGAGKTTVAQALIGTLARHGHRVAAIDADFNHTLSSWVSTFAAYPIDARAELDETRIVSLAAELEEKQDLVVIDTAGAATQATVFAIGAQMHQSMNRSSFLVRGRGVHREADQQSSLSKRLTGTRRMWVTCVRIRATSPSWMRRWCWG